MTHLKRHHLLQDRPLRIVDELFFSVSFVFRYTLGSFEVINYRYVFVTKNLFLNLNPDRKNLKKLNSLNILVCFRGECPFYILQ